VAEIPIERKPPSRARPFVLALIVLIVVAAAWLWWSNSGTKTSTTGQGPSVPATLALSHFLYMDGV
jgi:hypothetical protein